MKPETETTNKPKHQIRTEETLDSKSRVTKVTKDYGMFRLRLDNRQISPIHIRALADSIIQNPELMQHRPILVNEQYEVMDGQHRLEVAKQLNMPIYYTIAEGMGIEETRRLNATQASWTPMDYARSYAQEGLYAYQKYLQYRLDYNLGHNTVVAYMMLTTRSAARAGNSFKTGRLLLVNEKETEDLLSLLDDIRSIVPEYASRRDFAMAFRSLALTHGYKHDHFRQNLARYRDKFLGRFATIQDYQRALENIYNERLTDANRLRVF